MRAMNILKGFDSSKHSGVIAFFNKEYLKENILDRNLSIVIKNSAFLREKSDYDDFILIFDTISTSENTLREFQFFCQSFRIDGKHSHMQRFSFCLTGSSIEISC